VVPRILLEIVSCGGLRRPAVIGRTQVLSVCSFSYTAPTAIGTTLGKRLNILGLTFFNVIFKSCFSNSNFGRISHRFRDIDAFSSKTACFHTPRARCTPQKPEKGALQLYLYSYSPGGSTCGHVNISFANSNYNNFPLRLKRWSYAVLF